MHSSSSGGILAGLVRQLKQLASLTREKPTTTIEEYVLEHFLLYHGLVGTTPENQKQLADARADIELAIQQRNSHTLAIALKLQPLWWEDKLQSIFTELSPDDRPAAIETLLPPSETSEPESDPLRHDDWRVRANAANILGFLQCSEALPRLARALQDATEGTLKPAFPHIAYAIARLQTPAAKEVLQKYLYDQENWFRVDAARALCLWPDSEAASVVLPAMLDKHELSDYMAVMIARQYDIAKLLSSPDETISAGALEVVIGVVAAGSQTFTPEIVPETNIDKCGDALWQLWTAQPAPRHLSAVTALSGWLESQGRLEDSLPAIRQRLAADETHAWIRQCLQEIDYRQADQDSFAYHSLKLAGQLKISSTTPVLSRLIRPNFIRLDEAVEAAGQLGDESLAARLIELAQQIVDIDQRCRQNLSKQPVHEEHPAKARTYWLILKALGELPGSQGIDFLLLCSNDFAADKRQQALSSLLSAAAKGAAGDTQKRQLGTLLINRLQDPSTPVRITALSGISQLGQISLLPAVGKLLNHRETSLSRAAYQTLAQLHAAGFSNQVNALLQQCCRSEFDSVKRQQIADFAAGLQAAIPSAG